MVHIFFSVCAKLSWIFYTLDLQPDYLAVAKLNKKIMKLYCKSHINLKTRIGLPAIIYIVVLTSFFSISQPIS